MTVRIIGHDNTVYKQATCQNCGAVLEYTKLDVKQHHGRDYGGGADGHEYIKCPACTSNVILNSW